MEGWRLGHDPTGDVSSRECRGRLADEARTARSERSFLNGAFPSGVVRVAQSVRRVPSDAAVWCVMSGSFGGRVPNGALDVATTRSRSVLRGKRLRWS